MEGFNGKHFGRFIGEVVHVKDAQFEHFRVIDLNTKDNDACLIVPESYFDKHGKGDYPNSAVKHSTCQNLRHVPQPGEVWVTRSEGLALIVTGPLQYMEADGPVPAGASWFPPVYNRRKTDRGEGVLMIVRNDEYTEDAKRWKCHEIMSRLLGRTELTAAEFFLHGNARTWVP